MFRSLITYHSFVKIHYRSVERYLLPKHRFNRNYKILTERSSKFFYFSIHYKTLSNHINKMATATKILLPYLENTGLDGKEIYTSREWTERFRHYIKRIHDIDIEQILTDDTVPTDGNWDSKEPEIRQKFIWEAGPSTIGIITKREFNPDPDTIKIENKYIYSGNICQKETPTTAVWISSGQDKRTMRHPKNSGKN